LLETFERLRGATVVARLNERLPERLRGHLGSVKMSDPTATIPLDDAEELLLALDGAEGSGSVLELLAMDVASKLLMQEARVIQRRDLMGTVARMEVALTRPFLDAPTSFEVTRTDTGFSLTLGIRGRPRSARVLRPLALGFVRAADRFSLESGRTELRLGSDVFGDRATIGAQYRESVPPPPPPPEPITQDLPRTLRRPRMNTGSNLSDEVERILSSAMSSGSSSSPPPAARRLSDSTLPRTDPNANPPSRRSSGGFPAVRQNAPEGERRTASGPLPAVDPDDESDDPKKA
jgi:hypothetical protein